jgi:hypothetical protein
LLRWLISDRRRMYCTRSASVARVAACLAEVGWVIGPIRVWDGVGRCPTSFDGVLLVTGGSMPTDELMLNPADLEKLENIDTPITHHYRYQTIGAMLYIALGCRTDLNPESLQTDFETIYDLLRDRLSFEWITAPDPHGQTPPTVLARPTWLKPVGKPSRIAVMLASKFFSGGNLAELIAPCYSKLANETFIHNLSKTTRQHEANQSSEGPTADEARVRLDAITVSILLSLAGILGGPGYDDLTHCTQLDLIRNDHEGISDLTKLQITVAHLHEGLPMWRIVDLLSVFHTGRELINMPLDDEVNDMHLIGYRKGIYSVLPSVIYEMEPSQKALGFRCDNKLFGNVPNNSLGAVNTTRSDRWSSSAVPESRGTSTSIARSIQYFFLEPLHSKSLIFRST